MQTRRSRHSSDGKHQQDDMLVAIYKDEPPRRDAVQKACDGCRATKQKCDGLPPCSRCQAKGQACTYNAQNRKNYTRAPATFGQVQRKRVGVKFVEDEPFAEEGDDDDEGSHASTSGDDNGDADDEREQDRAKEERREREEMGRLQERFGGGRPSIADSVKLLKRPSALKTGEQVAKRRKSLPSPAGATFPSNPTRQPPPALTSEVARRPTTTTEARLHLGQTFEYESAPPSPPATPIPRAALGRPRRPAEDDWEDLESPEIAEPGVETKEPASRQNSYSSTSTSYAVETPFIVYPYAQRHPLTPPYPTATSLPAGPSAAYPTLAIPSAYLPPSASGLPYAQLSTSGLADRQANGLPEVLRTLKFNTLLSTTRSTLDHLPSSSAASSSEKLPLGTVAGGGAGGQGGGGEGGFGGLFELHAYRWLPPLAFGRR